MYTVQCTHYTVYIVHIIQCTVYTLYSVQRKLYIVVSYHYTHLNPH